MKYILLFLIVLIFSSAWSQNTNAWKSKISLGSTYFKGNTNKFDLRSDGELSHIDSLFEFSTSYKASYATVDSEEKNKEFQGTIKFDYRPYHKISPFVAITAYNNEFKGFVLRFSSFAGAKYVVFDQKNFAASLSAALQYDLVKYAKPIDTNETKKKNDEKFRLSFRPKIKWKISNTLTFEHTTFYQPKIDDFSDYIIDSRTALINKITEKFFLGIAFEYDYVSIIPYKKIEDGDIALVVSIQLKL